MPDRARPHALGSLQALSAIGNILAAVSLGIVVPSDKLGWGWRGLYYIGALPALIAVFVFSRLKEPERWVAARAAAVQARTTERFGRIGDLFTNPRWRRHTLGLAEVVLAKLPPGGRVGILGLTYKLDTKVVERSAGMDLAQYLIERGVPVIAYDPVAMDNARAVLKDRVSFALSVEECVRQANALVITTPLYEFRDVAAYANGRLTVVDCWRFLDSDGVESLDYVAVGVGRTNGDGK